MKHLFIVPWFALALASGGIAQNVTSEELRFREAVHKEQVEGDLNAAIKLYQNIASSKSSNRTLIAQALLHLGRCHEKQGNAAARSAYERILREYADQNEPTREARARLTKITGGVTARADMTTRRLIKPIASFQLRTVSRDGRYSAYMYTRRSVPMVVDLTTGSERELGSGRLPLIPAGDRGISAAISPDGSQVAYDHVGSDWKSEIRVIGVNSAEPRSVYRGPRACLVVDWSRDGSSLLIREMRSTERGPFRWLLVNVNTGRSQVLPIPAPPGAGRLTEAEQLYLQSRLSPDGLFVAYTLLNENSIPSVYVTSLDGFSRRRVTSEHAGAYVFGWSPDGTRLFYISDQSGTNDLWAIPIKDGKPQGLAALVKNDIGPVQGSGITDNGNLYYSARVNTGSVYVGELDIAASAIRKMQELPQPRGVRSLSARWSRDGTKLMMSRWTTQRFQLQNVIRDMATGQEQELKAARIFQNQRIDWTPDPESLLVTSAPLDTPSKLAIVDIETGKVRTEVRLSDAMGEYALPSISPDKTHVFAVKGGNMSNNSRVVRINLQTSEETDICPARPMVWALSPDGSQVACGGFGESIRVVSVQGGSGRDLVKGGAFSAMAWTPDGQHLVYTTVDRGALTSATYWIVPTSGGQPRRLDVPLDRLGLISMHPDGRRIAITSYGSWTEFWVLENLRAGTAAKAVARQ